MHEFVDLRSDTVTLPTPAMREAMARAEVGDDVWGEDPTVRRLERLAAERTGHEAALFVTSGTQGNLVSVLAQTRPGQEIVLDDASHILNNEGAGAAVFGGVQARALRTARGFPTPEQVRDAIRPPGSSVTTGLLCLENTHNLHGGTCSSPDELAALVRVAHAGGVRVHLDGARLFNAAVTLKRPVGDFTRQVDSVMFCLSKGLAAPAGSLVCGSSEFVARARQLRRVLGGGMRQVGVLAAPGLVALETMVDRLAEDHENCRYLAEGVAGLPGVRVDLSTVQTNILIFHVERPGGMSELIDGCLARGVKLHHVAPGSVRCVTHKDVDRQGIDRALQALREITSAW